jgi:predicted PurR-regulated permease PerM
MNCGIEVADKYCFIVTFIKYWLPVIIGFIIGFILAKIQNYYEKTRRKNV